jgi:hypothetical protein
MLPSLHSTGPSNQNQQVQLRYFMRIASQRKSSAQKGHYLNPLVEEMPQVKLVAAARRTDQKDIKAC